MNVFEFALAIVVDVPVTLLFRRYLFSETSGVFREVLAILYGFVMGGLCAAFEK